MFTILGPCGAIRQLSPSEVWRCQGRSQESFESLKESGVSDGEILVEGGKGTGGETAMALVLTAGYVAASGDRGVAGGRRNGEAGSDSEDEDGDGRAGGRKAKRGGERTTVDEALGNAAMTDQVAPRQPFSGGIGVLVEEWIEENLCGYLADSTTKQYAGVYGKWRAWAKRQGWHTEFLDKAFPAEDNEEKLLGFLGYLGWLGSSAATLKQAVFAIKDGHKRFGKGDPTERMWRLWMLLSALEKRSPKKARRLGVTPEMLKWIKGFLHDDRSDGGAGLDCAMLYAALTTAWFFMLRAKEYCNSGGVDFMITRGCDIKFVLDAEGKNVIGVTLQFRKTKTDQEAFGSCKTMYLSGVEDLCVVSALLHLQAMVSKGSKLEAKPCSRCSGTQTTARS